MVKYPTLEQLEQYRFCDAVSQSFLKSVLVNNTKPVKETVPMLIGTYLDALLFLPQHADDLFITGLAKRPSDTIKGFLDRLWEVQEESISLDLDVEGYKNRILQFVRQANYQPNWGDDAIWKSILKDGEEYWKELCVSQGKKIITKEEHDLCTQLAALTLSSPITAKYFIDQSRIDIYYQLPLYWTYLNEPCKGLLDILLIEHETKTIYIVDLKSTGVESLEEWFRIASQKKYPFQLSWYKYGVESNFKDLLEQGYTIQCRWMVIPTNTQRFKPWIVPCTQEMLTFGSEGFVSNRGVYYVGDWINEEETLVVSSTKMYAGWKKAVQIYKRCKSEGLLDWDLTHFDYQGKLPEDLSNRMFFV